MTRAELEALQVRKLSSGLRYALRANRFLQGKFATVNILRLCQLLDAGQRDALGALPFTTKAELLADQEAYPPYGSNLSDPLARYVRLHQTSGTSGRPMRWLDTKENWDWLMGCWELIYQAVGIEPEDRFFFPFSFGPFLAFWAGFEGASRRGNFVLAGGGTTTPARLRLILENNITVVACTPTYALRLAEVAAAENIDLAQSPVRSLILAGEPGASIPATRARIESAFGARVYDHCGMTEIGSLGIEFEEFPLKLFLLETEAIAEFIDPATGDPVAEGELGELVLTNLGRWGSPLIRYRTGDLVRWRADVAPKGHPYVYLDGGILGRTDEMFWVRGNSVYPSAVEALIRGVEGVAEFALEAVEGDGGTELYIQVEPVPTCSDPAMLAKTVSKVIQDRLHFRAMTRAVEPGALPRFELKARRFTRRQK
jgi:phenylacetate-CoA ligase